MNPAATVTRGYARTRSGEVHYYLAGAGADAGAGAETLVFFHQTASSGKMWLKVMAALGEGQRMIALDTPGFGASFDPPGQPSIAQYAAWLGEALTTLGVGRRHLIGHHTGACIAVEMAAAGAGSAESLTLVGPLPLTAQEREAHSRLYGAPFPPVASGSYLLDNWEYLRRAGADADVEVLHREMTDMLRAHRTRSAAYTAVWSHDFVAAYQAVACPILLMSARDDVLHPFFQRAQDLRPDALAVELGSGANFEPDLNAPGVAAALKAFLSLS